MKIIALVGPGSCGKTRTINLVYDFLISQGAISSNKKQEGANPEDFSDILTWKNRKIAFLSMGDYSYRVTDCIYEYDKLVCDVFICGCNDRFVRPFNEFAKRNATVLNKSVASNPSQETSANNTDAQSIIQFI